jgi:hypothetical protein
MKLKKIIYILLLMTIMSQLCVGSQDCLPPSGPPPDNADDNFSFNLQRDNITSFSTYIEESPFIGILNNGNVEAMKKLLKKNSRDWLYVCKDFNPEPLAKSIDLLIITTGALIELEASPNFKYLSIRAFFNPWRQYTMLLSTGCKRFPGSHCPGRRTPGSKGLEGISKLHL